MKRLTKLNRKALGVGMAGALTMSNCLKADEPPGRAETRPNIVYILADDLGYGDVGCMNPEGKIATPNIDRLAAEGMKFTDMHAGSAVCTPSRYGILTGRHCWRSRLQSGVLDEYGTPPLITHDRLTVPELLKQHDYATACVGKWHLGWEWPRQGQQMDFSRPITDGPTTCGFDYYFGTDAPNFPPYCFIENDRTVGIPTAPLPETLLKNNMASKPGPARPGWKLEAILPTITDKACDFVRRQAKAAKPFFLYFPLTSPHTPLAVNDAWLGKSGLGRYGDFVMETDAMVGRVLDTIEQSGVANNTLVIFTSDNGCAQYIGVKDLEAKGHYPSYHFRGYKADIWDGGHRIPFLARWPGKIKAGSTSDQLSCLTDLMATCADILVTKLPDNAGEDSVSMLPALLDTASRPLREAVVHHSYNGSFAIRQGKWKLELCPLSGSWTDPKPDSPKMKALPPVQLYDMALDVGERANVYKEHPEVVARLTKLLEKYVKDGRSTPGAAQRNDAPINLWKAKLPAAGTVSNDY